MCKEGRILILINSFQHFIQNASIVVHLRPRSASSRINQWTAMYVTQPSHAQLLCALYTTHTLLVEKTSPCCCCFFLIYFLIFPQKIAPRPRPVLFARMLQLFLVLLLPASCWLLKQVNKKEHRQNRKRMQSIFVLSNSQNCTDFPNIYSIFLLMRIFEILMNLFGVVLGELLLLLNGVMNREMEDHCCGGWCVVSLHHKYVECWWSVIVERDAEENHMEELIGIGMSGRGEAEWLLLLLLFVENHAVVLFVLLFLTNVNIGVFGQVLQCANIS